MGVRDSEEFGGSLIRSMREPAVDIWACPYCLLELGRIKEGFICRPCARRYLIQNGCVVFREEAADVSKDAVFQSEQMFNSTLTGKLFNAGRKVVSSEYMRHDQVAEFMKQPRENDVVVELGSGNRRLGERVLNIDLFPFPGVDVVADMVHMPIRTGVVDFAVLDTVLEHVPEPHKVVQELHRILRPGGRAICITPFLMPYHGYPKHYYNFSKDGLVFLFKDFSACEVEVNMGPAVALINYFAECFSLAFSGENKFLYTFFKGVALLPTFPFKYADRFWNPSGRAVRVASHLCARVQK